MAKVPDYDGRNVRSIGLPAQGFSMRAPDASGLAQGIAQVEDFTLRKVEQAREEAETTQTKEAAMAYDQFEQELKFHPETGLYNRRGKNAQDITNLGYAALDRKFKEIASGITNERVRKRFTDYRGSRRERFGAEFNRYEFEQNEVYKDQVDGGLLEMTMQGGALYYNDPKKVAEYQAQALGLVRARGQRKGVPEEALQVDLLKTSSTMLSNVIQRLAVDDPYKARTYFQSQQAGMTADDQAQIGNVIERQVRAREVEARQMQAIRRTELSSRVADASAAYLAGYDFDKPPTEAEFIASYGAEEGRARYREFQKVPEVGSAIRELASASPAERMEILQRFSPAQGGVASDGFQSDAKTFNALVSAASRFDKELQSDPAAYVATRSGPVMGATKGLATGDPDATAAYAVATIAEQQRLGVADPKLLTEWQAAAIASRFTRTEDGGGNAADLIQGLQAQWGKHWPAVFKQLQGKLPPAALVIGTGVDPQTAATLARIAPVTTAELKKGLDAAATSDARLFLGDRMAEFRGTLSGQVGGERTFATLYSEMERLTYAYMGQGKSAADAAEQAYKAVVDDRYTIKETYRVPSTIDADMIERGAQVARSSIDPATLLTAREPWMSDELVAARMAEIPRQSYWVTLPDESGLAMYLGGAAVLDKEGQPITRSWEDLTAEAAKPAAPNAFELRAAQPRPASAPAEPKTPNAFEMRGVK